jgi:hypothetical protein
MVIILDRKLVLNLQQEKGTGHSENQLHCRVLRTSNNCIVLLNGPGIGARATRRPVISREFGKSVDWLLTGEEKKSSEAG